MIRYPHEIKRLPYPVEAMNDKWKVADVHHIIKVGDQIANDRIGQGKAGTETGISKFARSLWFADINNQFEAAKKRIILLPKWRMLHSYPCFYPPLFLDL